MSLIITLVFYLVFFAVVWFAVQLIFGETPKLVKLIMLLLALAVLIGVFFGGSSGLNLPRW